MAGGADPCQVCQSTHRSSKRQTFGAGRRRRAGLTPGVVARICAATSAGRRKAKSGGGSGTALTTGRGTSPACGYSRAWTDDTLTVNTFTLYVALRAERPLDDAAVDAVAGRLRPDDPELCIWRDELVPELLRVSVDGPACDLESALEQGHELAGEIRALDQGLRVEEVVAMDEERQRVWRAQP
jgi:hypothetical protein